MIRQRKMYVQFTDTTNDIIFSLIKRNNKISATQISERLNISLSTAKQRIKELKEQKILSNQSNPGRNSRRC